MRHDKRQRTLWRALAALGVFALIAAGCGDDDGDDDDAATDGTEEEGDALQQYRDEGVTIGIANERPYGYEEGDEATGEAPELAREIFSRLDIEVNDFEVVDFGSLPGALNAGRLDVIAAGMFVTPDRAENVLFANPDYCAAQAFAVPEGNPDNISDFQSVADSDATLGVGRGFVEQDFAEEFGVPSDRTEVLDTVPDLFDALEAGRVDAVALTRAAIEEQTAEMEGFEATESFFVEIDGEPQLGCGAFGFTYEDQALRDAFNEELAAMQDAGEVFPVIEPFGFTQEEVDAAKDVTANELAEGAYTDVGDPPVDEDGG